MKAILKSAASIVSALIKNAPRYKTQEMYELDKHETQEMIKGYIEREPWLLDSIPDQYKTKKRCEKAVLEGCSDAEILPDQYKTHEMCKRAVLKKPWSFEFVHDQHNWNNTQKMYEKTVLKGIRVLEYVLHQLVTPKTLEELLLHGVMAIKSAGLKKHRKKNSYYL